MFRFYVSELHQGRNVELGEEIPQVTTAAKWKFVGKDDLSDTSGLNYIGI